MSQTIYEPVCGVGEPSVNISLWSVTLDLLRDNQVDCDEARERLHKLRQTYGQTIPLSESTAIWDLICPLDSDNPALPAQITALIRPYRLAPKWQQISRMASLRKLLVELCREQNEFNGEVCEFRLENNRILVTPRDPRYDTSWQHKMAMVGFIKGISEFLLDRNCLQAIGFNFPRPPANISWEEELGCMVEFDTEYFYVNLEPAMIETPLASIRR